MTLHDVSDDDLNKLVNRARVVCATDRILGEKDNGYAKALLSALTELQTARKTLDDAALQTIKVEGLLDSYSKRLGEMDREKRTLRRIIGALSRRLRAMGEDPDELMRPAMQAHQSEE